jgi:DNA-binding transcriptional ArsR family regulator
MRCAHHQKDVTVEIRTDAETTRLARLFHAASDPTRLALLRFVLHEEHCVSECVEQTGRGQGAVSKHLATLAEVGLLQSRRQGRFTYYRVRDTAGVQTLLTTAEHLEQPASDGRSSGPDVTGGP